MLQIFKLYLAAYYLAIFFFCPINSYALTLEQAYKEIPHRQTQYLETIAKIDPAYSKQLKKIFRLTDNAVVAKVEALLWLSGNKTKGKDIRQYKVKIVSILKSLKKIEVSKDIKPVKDLIVKAISEQKLFLETKNKLDKNWHKNSLVISSSNKLKSAYSILMKAFKNEAAINKQAFFDHLCALDFI